MKELWRENDVVLCIYDDKNYMVATHKRRTNKDGEEVDHFSGKSYFNSIDNAVKHLCRLEANDLSTSLSDWLVAYRAAYCKFDDLITVK